MHVELSIFNFAPPRRDRRGQVMRLTLWTDYALRTLIYVGVKGGGIRLGRPAARIAVGAVVRETEDDLAVPGCLAGPGFCRIEGCCVLRDAVRKATLAFLGTLDGYTL